MRRPGPWSLAIVCLVAGSCASLEFIVLARAVFREASFPDLLGLAPVSGSVLAIVAIVAHTWWEGKVDHSPHSSSWLASPGFFLALVGFLEWPLIGIAIWSNLG